jgi:hypothetical protein
MANENDRKATGNAGANDDDVKQRQISGDDVPPIPALKRESEQPGAGANTPAGPFPNSGTEEAKRAREKGSEIEARDKAEEEQGSGTGQGRER